MRNLSKDKLMNEYIHLPFFFQRTPYGVLLTNDIGEHHVLDDECFEKFVKKQKDVPSDTLYELEGKFFCAKKMTREMVAVYATRYRTKKYFIFESTSLHMIVVTNRCNQSCVYCHASSDDPCNVSGDMSVETADMIIKNIVMSPSKSIKIEFQGGEPTLNFEVIKHVVSMRGIFEAHGKAVSYVVCSNLLDISDEKLKFLVDNKISVSTSLDGPEHLHDQFRVISSGGGTHARVVSTLSRFKENGHDDIAALLTVHKGNVACLAEVVDEYLRLGFASVFIRGLNPFGRCEKNAGLLVYEQEDFIDAYKKAVEYIINLNRNGVQVSEEYFSIMVRRILTPFGCGFVDMQSPAGGAICGLMYDADGNVFASDEARMMYRSHADTEFLLGNVYMDARGEWFRGEKVERMLSDSALECIPGCGWCVFAPYCGIDTVRVYHDTRSGGVLRSICGGKKALFEYIFSKIYSEDVFVRKLVRSWAWMR